MGSVAFLILAAVAQVPPPDAATKASASLRAEEKAILSREARRLGDIADDLKRKGDTQGEADVRKLAAPAENSGQDRFIPLPEVVPAKPKPAGLANVPVGGRAAISWKAEVDAARGDAAKALLALAGKAAGSSPKHLARADRCLRNVLDRQPDQPEARRLLGYVPHLGGWATPYAVKQIADGKTLHPVYGWVNDAWVPHLEKGELPARGRPEGKEQWLPADQADAQRRDPKNAWTIHTEHFSIRTNVPLAEAIAFGRHLETLHELFESLFADVIGDNLPLAQRFKSRSQVGEKAADPHQVTYFAEKEQYVEYLRPFQGEEIEQSLGLYLPARTGKSRKGHAYFFRDAGGQIDVTATLYHEVSHQLLFESGIAGANDYRKNVGNYWVFEGLGTYFETLSLEKDGSALIGGLVGPRNEEARKNLTKPGGLVPLSAFIRYDENTFKGENGGDIHLHYQQASALTSYLMNGLDGTYREGFLDYVRDAARGQIRRTAGRSLEDRIDTPYAALEAGFLAYLSARSDQK